AFDPRLPSLLVPSSTADRQVVAVSFMGFTRHPYGVHAVGGLATNHEHRPVFATPVVLFVRHPGPDDLAGIRIAILRRRVVELKVLNPVRIDPNSLTPPLASWSIDLAGFAQACCRRTNARTSRLLCRRPGRSVRQRLDD